VCVVLSKRTHSCRIIDILLADGCGEIIVHRDSFWRGILRMWCLVGGLGLGFSFHGILPSTVYILLDAIGPWRLIDRVRF